MLTKQTVIKSFKEMPDEFSLDEAVDKLILMNKVQKAEAEIKEGKGLSTEQAKKKLKQWLN